MDTSLLELWNSMGWFARGIVIVLVLMSIHAVTAAIRKASQLRGARKATLEFAPRFSQALERGDLRAAEGLVRDYPGSHLATAFEGVISALIAREGDRPTADEVASLERRIELNSLQQTARLRAGLGVLATTGATAPFVGLLGTVVGVVNAFTGLAVAGSGGLGAISQGIAEALVATAIGLLVAIPSVWLYNYFVNRIELISMEITHATKELVDYLSFGGNRRYVVQSAERDGRGPRHGAELAHAAAGSATARS